MPAGSWSAGGSHHPALASNWSPTIEAYAVYVTRRTARCRHAAPLGLLGYRRGVVAAGDIPSETSQRPTNNGR